MTTGKEKVPVSRRAILQRINRVLARKDQRLYVRRGTRDGNPPRGWTDTGWYYIVDLRKNLIVAGHVDPESFAREIGALELYETLSD